MQLPKVSVIIPNYNYAQYLGQAIDSVLAQTYQHFEIVAVDDGSSDESEAVVRNYGCRVKWLQQQRQGVSAARNRGVRESHGDLVAFLDADDVWLPTKLEKQVQCLIARPEFGLVHCGVEEISESGDRLGARLDGLEGWVANEMLLFKRASVIAAGSTAMARRDIFEVVGGFDTRLSTGADWDFCYQVASRQQVGFVPDALVKYRLHTSNMHSNIHAMEHDMLIAYDKAFKSNSDDLRRLQRQCYGNLHMVLAGSFFRAGLRADFIRNALKSLWLTPENLTRLMEFPFRRLRMRASNHA